MHVLTFMPKGVARKSPVKPEVSQILKRFQEQILDHWEQAAKLSLPPTAALSKLALRDSFPQIIDSLADALLDTRSTPRLRNVSAIHAHERAFLTTFSIEQVLIEYNVLREIILSTLEKETVLTMPERQAIRRSFDEGVMQAAQEFFRIKAATDTVTRAETELVANRLQALQMITEAALAYASDIDRLLIEILAMVRQTLSVDTCAIFLLTNAGHSLVARAALGVEERVDPKLHIPASKGVAGQALKVLHPVIVPDLTDVEVASPALKPAGILSLMVVPLKIERRPIGVIQVGTQKRREFNLDEQAHMQIVADRIAIAIDHARLYSQIQKDKEDLQQEREVRERFVAALTHDLRTPLTAAKLNAQLVVRNPETLEKNKKLCARIAENIERVDRMIQDLLDSNRIRARQKLFLSVNQCNLRNIAQEVIEEATSIYGNRFIFHSDDTVLGYWDGEALRRLIENLLQNAVKYGSSKTPVILTLMQNQNETELLVHNHGDPIPKEYQSILFEPYKRIESSKIAPKKGWGIGLTLVQGVAQAHGGIVKVQSESQKGTTFTVVLPNDSRRYSG